MKYFIHEIPKSSQNPPVKKHYDVVVVGGGMSGLCAAIASARQGAKTALIHDRSVYGGNASSEVRLHVSGASCHWGKKNAAETGILMELQLDNKYLNYNFNFSIWDGVLWSKVKNTENLDSYMNTTMDRVISDGAEIKSIQCYQMTTETRYEFTAGIFVDATGHGTLGYFAGAEYRVGREGREEFNEKYAPDKPDGKTMGNTLYFVARDTGKPVKFVKPSWAYTFDESHFKHRYHGETVVYHDADDVVVLDKDADYENYSDKLVEKYDVQSGYWWIELGGDWDDIIKQAEDIRYELYKIVYGVWDHIKNGGDHGAENYELVWVGTVAGTRESRRLVGDYILTEHDIVNNVIHEDGVAYGGWPMDEHIAGGFAAKGEIPSMVRSFDGFYSIPYRCYYSKNIKNLMMAGRNISASKIAMGSTRVMGTCAIGGEAVGTAAAMAVKAGCTPREFGQIYIQELRQELLKNDCYIMGLKNMDEKDMARTATVTATSEKAGCEAVKVINGVARNIGETMNLWCSDGIRDGGETLSLKLKEASKISQIRLTFDPNLSEERCITISKAFIEKQRVGVDKELVKDYNLVVKNGDKVVWEHQVRGNYQRLNVIDLPEAVVGDQVQICVTATNGDPDARIFEVRIY
ncbi:MAG TPA: FAD-dependent oxidoreductase [Clostridiaceae bacterium]|nr:FAD-dependent oxidoreductase [Clostridiaceae bacterium]